MDYKKALGELIDNMRKADPERLKRIEDMGFDTSKVYFHGGPGQIKEFVPSKTWANTTKATFFTDDPNFSSHYAQDKGSANYPVFIKKSDIYNPEIESHREIIRKTDIEDVFKNLAMNTNSQNWQELETGSEAIQKAGFSGAKIKEIYLNKNNELIIPENLFVFEPEENVKSIWAQGLAKKGLMTGAAAIPSMDPLKPLGELVNAYRSTQEKVADAVTKQVTQPFGEADQMQKMIMRFGLDPLNFAPGAVQFGEGAVEMMVNDGNR